MGLRTSRRTYLALITGCAKASRSAAAYDLYRSRELVVLCVRVCAHVWAMGGWVGGGAWVGC